MLEMKLVLRVGGNTVTCCRDHRNYMFNVTTSWICTPNAAIIVTQMRL